MAATKRGRATPRVAPSKKTVRAAGSGKASKKRAPAAPKTKASTQPTASAKKRPKPVAIRIGSQVRAAKLAQRMPLVHFPASTRFDAWGAGPSQWSALTSNASRNQTIKPGAFNDLRGRHVFVYAGPSCFFNRLCSGDAILYFSPQAEVGGASGGAAKFDSGSLEEPTPKLQPWAKAPEHDRWLFFQSHSVPLSNWRAHFETWLVDCYDDPDRYLETLADRYAAGLPDRSVPPEIIEHNGVEGRKVYGNDCADRRAWTWEIHIEGQLSFRDALALHVPFYMLRQASRWVNEVEDAYGARPEIKALSANQPGGYESLYLDSGRILKELVGA